jgi:hypothetical protein
MIAKRTEASSSPMVPDRRCIQPGFVGHRQEQAKRRLRSRAVEADVAVLVATAGELRPQNDAEILGAVSHDALAPAVVRQRLDEP